MRPTTAQLFHDIEDNLSLAQVLPTTRSAIVREVQREVVRRTRTIPEEFRRIDSGKKKARQTFSHVCVECGATFTSSSRTSKFCINKGCRNIHNVRKARRKAKEAPAKVEDRKSERNIALNRYAFGVTDEFPKLVGRPSKFVKSLKDL